MEGDRGFYFHKSSPRKFLKNRVFSRSLIVWTPHCGELVERVQIETFSVNWFQNSNCSNDFLVSYSYFIFPSNHRATRVLKSSDARHFYMKLRDAFAATTFRWELLKSWETFLRTFLFASRTMASPHEYESTWIDLNNIQWIWQFSRNGTPTIMKFIDSTCYLLSAEWTPFDYVDELSIHKLVEWSCHALWPLYSP